mgnify:CR=1 FL=1
MFQTDHQGSSGSLVGIKSKIMIPRLEPYKIRSWQKAVVDAAHLLDLDHTLDNQSSHLPAPGTPAAKGDAQDLDGADMDDDDDDDDDDDADGDDDDDDDGDDDDDDDGDDDDDDDDNDNDDDDDDDDDVDSDGDGDGAVTDTHPRAHETGRKHVCRLLLEKKKKKTNTQHTHGSQRAILRSPLAHLTQPTL